MLSGRRIVGGVVAGLVVSLVWLLPVAGFYLALPRPWVVWIGIPWGLVAAVALRPTIEQFGGGGSESTGFADAWSVTLAAVYGAASAGWWHNVPAGAVLAAGTLVLAGFRRTPGPGR